MIVLQKEKKYKIQSILTSMRVKGDNSNFYERNQSFSLNAK